eukprot:10949645-Alexandrium_andersonii.AAC.1
MLSGVRVAWHTSARFADAFSVCLVAREDASRLLLSTCRSSPQPHRTSPSSHASGKSHMRAVPVSHLRIVQ